MAGLTSVPLASRVRWWTKLARLPRVLWSTVGEMATMLTDHSQRQPSRRKLALIRLGLLIAFILLSPVALILRSRFRRGGPNAFEALDARVREIWKTSPEEGIALLRSVFDQLRGRDGIAGLKQVQIDPFGRFEPWDVLAVQRHLYNCEFALGRYEEALSVATAISGRVEEFVLQQVDCLVAMRCWADAVALLERNLDIDGWRGTLRRRLRELGGSPLRSVN